MRSERGEQEQRGGKAEIAEGDVERVKKNPKREEVKVVKKDEKERWMEEEKGENRRGEVRGKN